MLVATAALAAAACAPAPPPPPVYDPLLPGVVADGLYAAPRLSADGDVVVFSTKDTSLAAGREGAVSTVFALDLPSRAVEAHPLTPGCEDASMASVSPDGRYVAYVCTGGGSSGWALSVWDRTDGSVTSTPTTTASGQPIVALATAVTDDARVLYYGNIPTDPTAGLLTPVVWDSVADSYTGAPLDDLGERVTISGWGFGAPQLSADGSSAWVDTGGRPVAGVTGQPALWDLGSGTWRPLGLPATGLVDSCCVRISPDHSGLAAIAHDELYLHDIASGTTRIESTYPRGATSTHVTAVSGVSLWLDLASNAATPSVTSKVLFDADTGVGRPITGAPPEALTTAVSADLSVGIALGAANQMYLLTPAA